MALSRFLTASLACFTKLFRAQVDVITGVKRNRGKALKGMPRMGPYFEVAAPQALSESRPGAIETNVDKDTNVSPL